MPTALLRYRFELGASRDSNDRKQDELAGTVGACHP